MDYEDFDCDFEDEYLDEQEEAAYASMFNKGYETFGNH